jgi:class 3 adenylate cyclase
LELEPKVARAIEEGQFEHCPTCGAVMPEGFRFCGQCGRALSETLAPVPGDVITIVFTDLVGFTTFASQADDEKVMELLRAYHGLVRDQIAGHGGFEVKQYGDGLMIAFASAKRAVRCATAIQRALRVEPERLAGRRTRIRIGLNSGDAIREGDDFFGHTVNVASRIAGRARGGQVLASEATRVLAGHVEDVRFDDYGLRTLRGIRRRHRLFEVVWREPEASGPPATRADCNRPSRR